MRYYYETHLHTKEGSACARNTAEEMVLAYKKAGYSGIMVTDHFYYANTSVDRTLPWEDWVENYCKGYEHAKKLGDEIGLQVFFGWESGYHGTDFLVYGPDKQWLLTHPEIKDATVEEQYKLVSEAGGMVIHAHPYREAGYIPEIRLFPEYVDGVEVSNAGHFDRGLDTDGRSLYDKKALAYAKEHQLPYTGGSDIHATNLVWGGMEFSRRLSDVGDYVRAIKAGEGKPMDYVEVRKNGLILP